MKDLGTEQIRKITEAGINMGPTTRMDENTSTERLSKFILGNLSQQPAGVMSSITGGGKAGVPGYGVTDAANMAEKMSAQFSKVVEITGVWGTDVANYMQYAAPISAVKHWKPAEMFSLAGVASDAGFKGAKFGRAMMDEMVKGSEGFARMELFAAGRFTRNVDKNGIPTGKYSVNENEVRQHLAVINQKMDSFEGWARFMRELGPKMQVAMAATKDPNIGLQLIKDLKLSKNFLPQLITTQSGSFIDRVLKTAGEALQASYADEIKKREAMVDEVYYGGEKLTDSRNKIRDQSKQPNQQSWMGINRRLNITYSGDTSELCPW